MKRRIFSVFFALVLVLVLSLGVVMTAPVAAAEEPIDLAVNGESPWTSKAFTFTDVLPGEDLVPFPVKFKNIGSDEGALTFSMSYVEHDIATPPAPHMDADEFASLVYVAAVTHQYFCPAYPEGGGIHNDLPNWLAMDSEEAGGNKDGKVSLYELMSCSPIPWAKEPGDTLPAGEASEFVITFKLGDSLKDGVAGGDILLGVEDSSSQGDGISVTISATLEQVGDSLSDTEQSSGNVFQAFGVAGLDKDFYKVGDEPIVTIYDAEANDPMAIDYITVRVASTTDGGGDDVELSETGSDTGIFDGSFTLLGEPPANREADEIVVFEGDTITLTYDEVEVATATVDEEEPVFEDPFVESDEDFYKNADTITLTATLDDAGYTVTADFSAIDSEYTAEDEDVDECIITYTISEDNTIADGEYTIPVTAKDAAGNSTTDESCSVTLDNTAPVVTEPTASPAVLQPNTETEVTFTATVSDGEGFSDVDTVTIDLDSIGGSATQEMTEADSVGAPGVYTCTLAAVSVAEADYPLPITATDALGNVNDTVDITLRVLLDVNPPEIVSTDVEYPVGAVSAREGDPVVITAVVTDDLAGIGWVGILDASAIGGPSGRVLMTQVGSTDTWTTEGLTVGRVDPGIKTLTIIAKDLAANIEEATVDVEVVISLTGCCIDLYEGWNLVSLPLIPDVAAIETVLGDVIVDSVWAYEPTYLTDGIDNNEDGTIDEAVEAWLSYSSGVPSDLTYMRDGKGYWVKMSAAATLVICGKELRDPPATPPTYAVVEGWNLIGFKSVEDKFAHDYLLAIMDDVVMIYGYNAAAGIYVVVNPFATLPKENFEVGHGYWIAVTEAGTIYP